MNYQKQKILERLSDLFWLVEGEAFPKSQNNWKTTEIIQLTKNGTSIFFAVEKDPTPGYLGGKFSSANYDIVVSNVNPTDMEVCDYKIIAEINLGKKWEEKLDDFIARIERYAEHKPYILDLNASRMKSRNGFIKELKEVFQIPSYCSDNLDAIYDCMTNMSWLPDQEIHVRIHNWKGVEKHQHFDYEGFLDEIKQHWDQSSSNKTFKTFIVEKQKNG